jgi:hypothetical protein
MMTKTEIQPRNDDIAEKESRQNPKKNKKIKIKIKIKMWT